MDLKEKLKRLKLDQERAKELFIKLQGAIEFVESMLNEENVKEK